MRLGLCGGLLFLSCAVPTALPAAADQESAIATQTLRFKCTGGRELKAELTTRASTLVAIVDAGDGPYVLPILPSKPGPVEISWSDGARTLSWGVGVRLMWMDGPTHLMCARSSGHTH